MNYITMTRLRNHRFTQAFREAAARDRLGRTVGALLDEVMHTPVERGFFVSVDHVLVMDRKRREGVLPPMSGERARMWAELFRQFDLLLAADPRRRRTEAAAAVVSFGRAPRFYIGRRTALKLIKNNEQ